MVHMYFPNIWGVEQNGPWAFHVYICLWRRLMVQQFQMMGKRDLWKIKTIGLTESRIKRAQNRARLDEKKGALTSQQVGDGEGGRGKGEQVNERAGAQTRAEGPGLQGFEPYSLEECNLVWTIGVRTHIGVARVILMIYFIQSCATEKFCKDSNIGSFCWTLLCKNLSNSWSKLI